MEPTRYVLLALAMSSALLAGCRDGGSGDDVDGGVTGDAFEGTGCTAMTPRAVPLESFVMPTGFEARMEALIDGAGSSLDIQMYLFTVDTLVDKLVAAKNRGVTIRLLLDPDHQGNQNVTPALTSGGVNWKKAPSIYEFSHAKYLIVDKQQAVIMSSNWNHDAFTSERNYGVVDKDPDDLEDLQAIFDQDWASASGQTVTVADLTCTRLIVSPTNARQRVLELINSAKTTLDVEAMYISETTVRNAIGSAKMRGVNVRVIVNEATDESVTYFKNLGIPVKTPGSFNLHAKLIIADNVAFVGSVNYSLTSLSKNREVGALVFEPAAFMPIQTQFNSDWNNSDAVP